MPIGVLTRLGSSKLYRERPYGAFGLMLAVGLGRDLALLLPHYGTHGYALAWEITLPVLMVAQACAAVSLYRAITDLYPRIGRFAVYLFGGALLLTAIVCIGLLPWELTRMREREAILRLAILLQRWIASEIAGGLLLAVLFLARFPRPAKRLPRNLVLHAVWLATYFAATAALMLFENLAPLGAHVVLEQLELALVIVLYGLWAACLSAAGQASEPWTAIAPEVTTLVEARERATRKLATLMADFALRQATGRR